MSAPSIPYKPPARKRPPQPCKDCSSTNVYIYVLGILFIITVVVFIIIQYIAVIFYHQNQSEVEKIFSILQEILIYLKNMTSVVDSVEKGVTDIDKLVASIITLEADIAKIF